MYFLEMQGNVQGNMQGNIELSRGSRYIELFGSVNYLTVPLLVGDERRCIERRHPPAKGFMNFVESLRYSRISPRPPPCSRNLKGRQVKVPHRPHKMVFFAVSVPLFRLFPLYTRAPSRQTGRRFFSHAPLFFSG